MGLFSSKGHQHLDGHKEMTKHKDVISILSGEHAPKEVYFPSMSPNGKPIEFCVQPGDEVKVGTLIGKRTDFEVPIYSSVSGIVKENQNLLSPQVGRPIPHLVIENDMQYQGVEIDKNSLISIDSSKEEIFEAIKKAGLVGMGGAGFPTYIKYNNPQNIDVILINGVECEPYLTTDFFAMQSEVDNLLLGAQLLIKAAGAQKAIIAFKVHKEEVRNLISQRLDEHPYVEYVEVPDQYPMGWERTLIKQVLKKEYNRLPSEAGVIVNNAQTVIEIAKTLTTGKVPSTRLVTVSGDGIKNPANVLCPIGTLACNLIAACGGYEDGDINLIPGGPMCSKALKDDKFAMLLPNGSLTILKFKELNQVACLRCGACTMHCPANLQPVELKIAFERKDVDRLGKLEINSCVECGMCSYVCPSKIDVTEAIKKGKLIYKLMKK